MKVLGIIPAKGISVGIQLGIVVGDRGSAQELLASSAELSKRFTLQWFADPNGIGKDLLRSAGISYEARLPSVADVMPLLIGVSATAVEWQIKWTKHGRKNGQPVIWLEDLWGTGSRSQTRCVDPTHMLVNDTTAGRLARSVRPGLPVFHVGKPTFERDIALVAKHEAERTRLRRSIDADEQFIVSYWSGGNPDRVRIHVDALRAISGVRVLCLWHQKLKYTVKDDNRERLTPPQLIALSDAIVAEWGGTQGYLGALCGRPTVVMMFPDDLRERVACGFTDGDTPLTNSCGLAARDPEQLAESIAAIRDNYCKYVALTVSAVRQDFSSILRPGAASRIAEATSSILGDI